MMTIRLQPILIATCLAGGPTYAQEVRPEPIREVRANAPTVTLREVLRLGSAEGRNDSFGRVTDVALGPRGRIYVADDANHRVSVFEANGRFRAAVGRRGRGPGELETPWRLAVDANDTLFVFDVAQSRISVFDPTLRHRRDFRVPPQWLVGSIGFLPDGRLLVAAYGRGEPGTVHVLRRDGTRERTFGPRPVARGVDGFESSLLGGTAAVGPALVAYSNKSPYEIVFHDLRGRARRHCTGDARWTTPPTQVVKQEDGASLLDFGRYVHSANIVSLGADLFLNVIHDPVAGRQVLDLVTPACELRRRTVLDVPLAIVDHAGSRLAAVQTLEFPEVVIYTLSVSRSASR
jgi:6-bladed beta-propeller